jgi:diketogulonate reductase-like aldo/keto reductase
MSTLALDSTLTLADGVHIPRFGLGVFRAGRETKDAVRCALEAGYRHVDTAHIYRNEVDVGAAIRGGPVPRAEVFVTTKLWNDHHGYDAALRAFDESLAALRLEYVDLYLLHWPVPELRLESWRALEAIHRAGQARAIGVSNFTARHLQELVDVAQTLPAVNQVELHPFLPQPELVAACRRLGVAVEAYSPLAKGRRLDHPVLAEVGRAHNKTVAQVMIRWALQKGFIVIPKSAHPKRIQENAQVFDFTLTDAEVAHLDGLDEGLRTAWDPTHVA